ncbi:CNH domain-containing protein [Myxozyma melibiosi]|uniref:CNH domain-containing protein n=1 Tax=Myxozyma melibiosi TaxID=54550 RepID=A0ABR1F0Y7_9ASCO
MRSAADRRVPPRRADSFDNNRKLDPAGPPLPPKVPLQQQSSSTAGRANDENVNPDYSSSAKDFSRYGGLVGSLPPTPAPVKAKPVSTHAVRASNEHLRPQPNPQPQPQNMLRTWSQHRQAYRAPINYDADSTVGSGSDDDDTLTHVSTGTERLPFIREETLGPPFERRPSSRQPTQVQHTRESHVPPLPPKGTPITSKQPSLRSFQQQQQPQSTPSRPLPKQSSTPPVSTPPSALAHRSLPTTPQSIIQSPPLIPPHATQGRSPSPTKQYSPASPYTRRPITTSRHQTFQSTLPTTPTGRSPPMPPAPQHAPPQPPVPPPHSFNKLGLDSFIPEDSQDSGQDSEWAPREDLKYMSLSDLKQKLPSAQPQPYAARPSLNLDTTTRILPMNPSLTSVSPSRSSHSSPLTHHHLSTPPSSTREYDDYTRLPAAAGMRISDVSPTRSAGSYSSSPVNLSPARSNDSSRSPNYGSSPGEMMSDDELYQSRGRWSQYQTQSSPVPSPPRHSSGFGYGNRNSTGYYDFDSSPSSYDNNASAIPPTPPPHTSFWKSDSSPTRSHQPNYPARANTTGRVPLSADGNLRAQCVNIVDSVHRQERRAHGSLPGGIYEETDEEYGSPFMAGNFQRDFYQTEVYDPADRSQLDLFNDPEDMEYEEYFLEEENPRTSIIPVAGTKYEYVPEPQVYGEEYEEGSDYYEQTPVPTAPLNIVKPPAPPPKPVPASPVHSSPVHSSPVHSSPAHSSPVHSPSTQSAPPPESRPESPTESATSTHADNNAMKRYGLPTSIPDTSFRAGSILRHTAPSDTDRTKANDDSLRPWALSDVYRSVRKIMSQEANFMREETVISSMGELFKKQLPMLNTIVAEDCAIAMINSFMMHGVMERIGVHVRVPEDDEKDYQTKLADMSGVLPLLAGHGCYSQCWRMKESGISSYRCYSKTCSLTARKAETRKVSMKSLQSADNWSEAVPEDVKAGLSKTEIVRQNIMFEFIALEGQYLADVKALLKNFRDVLLTPSGTRQPIVSNPKKFVKDVIQNSEEIMKVNDKYLYQPLLLRQQEDYVVSGIGDILINWIKKASGPYIKHGSGLGRALELYNDEKSTNIRFAQFVSDFLSKHPRSGILAVHTRLVRYPLLIRRMIDDGRPMAMEKTFLERACGSLSELGHSFQTTFSTAQRRYILQDLEDSIRFPDSRFRRNLELDSKNRKIMMRTAMDIRIGNGKRQALFMILLDNFLLITKEITTNVNKVRYDVVTTPIPIDLLILVSASDEGASTSGFMNLPKSATMPNLSGAMSGSSADESTKKAENKTLYPFRVRFLGRDGGMYTMYAKTSTIRENWCSSIMLAKNKHALSLVSLRSEPFALEVVSDMAFAYDGAPPELPLMATGTAIERALRKAESDQSIPARSTAEPMIKSRVNCAASFYTEDLGAYARAMTSNSQSRKAFVLVGCEFGVYLSDGTSRLWAPVLALPKVRQIQVLPEFGLAILLSDKTLMAYNLEALLVANPFELANHLLSPAARVEKWLATKKEAEVLALMPQQISETREIASFSIGVLHGRTVIVCRKRQQTTTAAGLVSGDDGVSILRVYEPIAGKSITFWAEDIAQPASDGAARYERILGLRGDVNGYAGLKSGKDLMRETDLISTPKPCLDTTVLKKMIVLHTVKGFEIMGYPSRLSAAVPDLKTGTNDHIRKLLSSSHGGRPVPLGFFKVSDNEFLLAYSTLCLKCDRTGTLSKGRVITFNGRPRQVTFAKPYILGFDKDFIEIRHVESGELKQVITGTDIRLVSAQTYVGAPNRRSAQKAGLARAREDIVFVMAHPEVAGRQLVMRIDFNREMIASA